MALLAQMAMRARYALAPPGGWRDHLLLRLETLIYRRARGTQLSLDPMYDFFLRGVARSSSRQRRQLNDAQGNKLLPGLQVYTRVMSEDDWKNVPVLAESLLAQTYPRWLWTICAREEAARLPSEAEALLHLDPRIRVAGGSTGAPPTRDKIPSDPARSADYLGLLAAESVLPPHALGRFANAILEAEPSDLIFADEDSIDDRGRRGSPFFKPDWSPALLLSVDLLEGLFFVRWARVEENQPLWKSQAPASLRETRLQLTYGVGRVIHIPEVLCHLRPSPLGERDSSHLRKAWKEEARAVKGYLSRLGLAEPEVRLGIGGFPSVHWARRHDWKVAVVIPNRDQPVVLDRCLATLAERTRYPLEDVIVVDTGSLDPRTHEVYRRWSAQLPMSVLEREGEFNFGATCNLGARHARGNLLLFLNNDTQALEDDWLDRMVQWFELEDVGVVGAKLLFPDGRIQHAGVIVGMGGIASHLFHGEPEFAMGMFGSDHWYRDLSAVTGACMLVARPGFEALGGFDEQYRINYQDIDFCLRARDNGLRVIFTPDARLIHHESLSHLRRVPRADFERAIQLWSERQWLGGDPFFNSNLSYMSPVPAYRRSVNDNPSSLARRLSRRLPRKEILQLPDDLP